MGNIWNRVGVEAIPEIIEPMFMLLGLDIYPDYILRWLYLWHCHVGVDTRNKPTNTPPQHIATSNIRQSFQESLLASKFQCVCHIRSEVEKLNTTGIYTPKAST